MAYDLVIRNGLVVDGSGDEPFHADVGIVRDRIASIGRLDEGGITEVDADGHAVSPGFIDGHTHMDAQVMWDSRGSSSCWHGVTTVVMGNCGFSLAPVRADARALVVRNLERAEDISAAAMNAGISWTWESFSEYLDEVERRPKGINYAAYVGHSALRTWAMGERAFEEAADEDDEANMRRHLRESLRAGAIGFSTSRSASHETSDDRPVASRLASWDEVRRLVSVLSEEGRGIFELALEPAALSPDESQRTEFFRRLASLCIDLSVRTTFGVVGGLDGHLLDFLERVNAAGGIMFGQSHSRGIASLLSFSASTPFDVLPVWQEIRSRPVNQQVDAFADHRTRELLVASARVGPYRGAVGPEARKPDFDRLYVMTGPLPPYPTVSSMASARRVDPLELMLDLAIETNLEQFFVQPLSPDDPAAIFPSLVHPNTVMTFSDSGAHVSQIIDSSIQSHLLGYWVRERGAFTLAEGVRMLTSIPASSWGMRGRGLLAPGMVADLNIFDPERVSPAMPEIAHDLPGGARRLRQSAIGFRTTIVNGQIVLVDGESTGAFPGMLVRDGGGRGVG